MVYLREKMLNGVVPLTYLNEGQEGIVEGIAGGRGLTFRLYQMGILPKTKVKVLYKGFGPLVIDVRGSKVAIGYGMADKIFVRPL